jgi:hypothetical protein
MYILEVDLVEGDVLVKLASVTLQNIKSESLYKGNKIKENKSNIVVN